MNATPKFDDWEVQLSIWIFLAAIYPHYPGNLQYFLRNLLESQSFVEAFSKARSYTPDSHRGINNVLHLYSNSGGSVLLTFYVMLKLARLRLKDQRPPDVKIMICAIFSNSTKVGDIDFERQELWGEEHGYSGSNLGAVPRLYDSAESWESSGSSSESKTLNDLTSWEERRLTRWEERLPNLADINVRARGTLSDWFHGFTFTCLQRLPPAGEHSRIVQAGWTQLRKNLLIRFPSEVVASLLSSKDYNLVELEDILRTGVDGFKSPERAAPVTQVLDALQRLRYIVTDEHDIVRLIKCGYYSAADIVNAGDKGEKQMIDKGVSPERCKRIINHARLVARYHEGLLVKAARERSSLQVLGTANTDPPTTAEINLARMFGMEAMSCEECASLTGPAAYFVELLDTLQGIKVKDSGNLLGELLRRRPDLADLELSCANVKTTILYIDLVNEVLESVLSHLLIRKGSPEELQLSAFNMDGDDSTKGPRTSIQNTDFEVYKHIASAVVSPMHTFPYNDAIHSIRAYLRGLGASRLELLKTLRSPYRIEAKEKSEREVISVRVATAESLGLQHEDYVAITKGGYYHKAEHMTDKDWENRVGLRHPASYWGYKNVAARGDHHEAYQTCGLDDIKRQFLPRSGLDFEDLLILLSTGYLDRSLRVTNESGDGQLTGSLGEMRLVPSPGVGRESIYDKVQRFLRLKEKLGWPTEELDAVIVSIMSLQNKANIDAGVLDELAAVKELSEMTQLSPVQLQPLWGDIYARGENSLFRILFLNDAISECSRHIFCGNKPNVPETCVMCLNSHTVLDNLDAISSAIGIPPVETKAIYSDYDSKQSKSLSISLLSYLYRVVIFCKILHISTLEYRKLKDLYRRDFFSSPTTTLEIVTDFKSLHMGRNPWTIEQLLFVTTGHPNVADDGCHALVEKCLEITHSICSSISKVEQKSKEASVALRARQLQAILACLRVHFADLDLPMLQFLLSCATNVEGKPGTDQLISLGNSNCTAQGDVWEGYFHPPSTDSYIITCLGEAAGTCSIDGELLNFIKGQSCTEYTAVTKQLQGGHWYKLEYCRSMELRWTARHAVEALGAKFSGDMAVESRNMLIVEAVVTQVRRVAILIKRFHLSLAELMFWHQVKPFNLSSIDLERIHELARYDFLREEFMRLGGKEALLSLYKWLYSSKSSLDPSDPIDKDASEDSRIIGELASRLARVTGWRVEECDSFLKSKYPGIAENELVKIFQDIYALFDMHKAIRFIKRLNIPTIPLPQLFEMANPGVPPTHDTDFKHARDLYMAVQSRCETSGNSNTLFSTVNDDIRSARRTALTQCLLQQEYARKHGITEADQLFGHFLIDVQMGPTLQTSRLKQAISTVQLFIKRCILGAEVNNGIPSDVLEGNPLDSILRYRIWEATRKTRLYPENWIDPTLRDTKTEQFKALETALTQTSLNLESINNLIRNYIHDVDAIADLQIEAYLWDRVDKKGADAINATFHIFGRTRAAPYIFYYRTMRLRNLNSMAVPCWSSWVKIDVDITVFSKDLDGNPLYRSGSYLVPVVHNSRLFVLLPEITAGQSSTTPPTEINLKQEKVGVSTPQRYWEIRMGYIELQTGRWSPKRTSDSCIHVDAEEGALIPIESFQFWTQCDNELIAVSVEYCPTNTTSSYILGQFEMRKHQMVVVGNNSLPKKSLRIEKSTHQECRFYSLPTVFSKLHSDGEQSSEKLNWFGEELNSLLGNQNSSQDIVVSFDGINSNSPEGLIFESSDHTKSTQHLIHFPLPDMNKISTKEPFIKERTLMRGKLLKEQELSSHLAPDLVKGMAGKQGLEPIYEVLAELNKDTISEKEALGWYDGLIHECVTPSAIYTWELAVHIPSLIMERLMASQQFELALTVARLLFNPRKSGTTVDRCWTFPPFRDEGVRSPLQSTDAEVSDPSRKLLAVKQLFENEELVTSMDNVHAAARGSPVAYMKRVATKYIEALVLMGDQYFRQSTLESVPFAIEMYTEALHIFGPKPVQITRLGKRIIKTYNQIKGELHGRFKNVTVDMELGFPFYVAPEHRGDETSTLPIVPSIRTGYFCVSANPEIARLRDVIGDRLSKIRNGLDINGRKQTLALFEPPIDPGVLVRSNTSRPGVAGLLSGMESPMPYYRFNYILQRSYELVHVLKSCGQQLLSIKERRDSEAMSILRSKHQQALRNAAKQVRIRAKNEIQSSRRVLEEERNQQETRLRHLLALVGSDEKMPHEGKDWEDFDPPRTNTSQDPLCPSTTEATELSAADDANGYTKAAAITKAIGQGLFLLPDTKTTIQPWGIGMEIAIPGGTKLGHAAMAGAAIFETRAQFLHDQASQASRRAMLERQLQERRLSANIAGCEWMKIKRQLESLDAREATCDAEIESQELEITQTRAEEEWMRNKYTSEQLYIFLDNSMSNIFHQTYMLANEMAKVARRALDFEHALRFPHSTSHATDMHPGLGGYWEEGRDGQLSAEGLLLDLKRMEIMHMENRTHDFEISKTVSLRQISPMSLLKLRANAVAEFSLPEYVFDMEFPGHYCRRIASVSVSIPCILGAYMSVNCTLSLLRHEYRISPTIGKSYATKDENSFRTDQIPITSIAVSNGLQDPGVFNLEFHGTERYGPFEGAGAISTWRLELPEVRQFDYNTISDVLLHLRYTSIDGGQPLRKQATDHVKQLLKDTKLANESLRTLAVDLKSDYPMQYHQMSSTDQICLPGLTKRFPWWAQQAQNLTVAGVNLLIHPNTMQSVETVKITGGSTEELVKQDMSNGYLEFSKVTSTLDLSTQWVLQFNKGCGKILSTADRIQLWLLIHYTVQL